MNDANFAAVISALQDAAREDRQNLTRHIDDCIQERREAKRDRHELAGKMTSGMSELHGRINRMERRGQMMWIIVGGSVITMLLGIIGWVIAVSINGIFLSPIGGG